MQHSQDPRRLANVLTSYLDESATDGGSPIAVVGGLLLQPDTFFYLDIDWEKAIAKHGAGSAIHMKDFGQHGKFGRWTEEARSSLFRDLAKIINEHKICSIAATLTTAQYGKYFAPHLS